MPSRPEYAAKTRFSPGELALEQEYRALKLRQHNRFAHGWGVVCGLQVLAANDAGRPWAVRICPGLAQSPCGDEIELRTPLVFDIAAWFWSLRTERAQTPATAVIAIRYLSVAGASPAADSVRVDALPDLVIPADTSSVCSGGSAALPSANTLYVPLAQVRLSSTGVTAQDILDLRLNGGAPTSAQ